MCDAPKVVPGTSGWFNFSDRGNVTFLLAAGLTSQIPHCAKHDTHRIPQQTFTASLRTAASLDAAQK